jgi:hypothetical protein
MESFKLINSVIFITLLSSNLICGQDVNLHGGLVVSQLISTKMGNTTMLEVLDEYKTKVGFTIGVSTEINISKDNKFSLSPQLKYTELGAKYNLKRTAADPNNPAFKLLDVDKAINLNYIMAPILMNYKLNNKFSFSLGGQLSYLISYRNDLISDFSSTITSINKYDYGMLMGAAFAITNRINANLNYYIGFNKVERARIESPYFEFYAQGKNKTTYLSFEAVYRLKKAIKIR